MTKGNKKYQIIVDSIIKDIEDGLLLPNEQIYTEEQLADNFSVSRVTVRKAIDILVKEGYLVKKQGRGTFVKGTVIRKQLNDVVSFYKSSLLRGEIPTTELHLLELEEPSLFVMKALKITRNKKVWHMKRVRLTDGFPMIFEESYWNYDIVGELTPEIASISVFNHLKHMIKIAYATEDIDAITANEELASLLKTSVGFPLLRTYMVFYTDKDEPFEISTNYHRTDRLKLTLFRTLNE
ncbi:GntR family transcriptional regulator [Traorella massiliensis]|uniref:GntR family transcriptional regulator n=1 Tax=Traorella massiliensis TaxID=1903263 RepID=UPI0023539220|nr:GntR family transcriptional regulator [Traorella massiliensis]